MTDKLGRTLEHRVIILEQQIEIMEEEQAFLFMTLIKWLDAPAEDRNFLRTVLSEKEQEIRSRKD